MDIMKTFAVDRSPRPRYNFPKKKMFIFKTQVFHHSKANQEGRKFGFYGSAENKISEFQPQVSQNSATLTFLCLICCTQSTVLKCYLHYGSFFLRCSLAYAECQFTIIATRLLPSPNGAGRRGNNTQIDTPFLC